MSTLIRGLGRLFLFLSLGATGALLWAQPPLTTIRDTVYKADGKPYDGLVLIEWKTFQASNNANVGQQATTVKVVNGSLSVRLTPTTAANNAYYLVRYTSDGQFQFSEIWSVPPSSASLKLADIRATLLPGGILAGGAAGGVIVGAETGGSSVPGFGDAEIPAGAINGSNPTFVLAAAPSPATSLSLFRNGLLQNQGSDYTINGLTITFSFFAIPQFGDVLKAFYRTAATNSPTSGHALLGTTHTDVTPTAPARGGLIVGQGGTTPTWAQLPLGPAGRCLTSNGTDAIWSPCLYTGFTPGSVPFIDSAGNLTQNNTTLAYNSLQRKFSIGNNIARATLNVFDAGTSAVTELIVRAGSNQGSVPMQTWMSLSGSSLAFVNADGGFNVQRLLTNSTSTRAGFSDVGTPTDPTANLLSNGDAWYNTTSKSRKSFEGGQVHATEQVICSSTGVTTSSNSFTDLGSCTLAAASLFAGDRLRIEATYLHSGVASASALDVVSGSVTFAGRTVPAGDDVIALTINIGLGTDRASWSNQSVGAASGVLQTVGDTPFTSGGTLAPLRFRGRLLSGAADSMRLLNFTVTRIPQQSNP